MIGPFTCPRLAHDDVTHLSAAPRLCLSVCHPEEDFRRTACTSLLQYVVEAIGLDVGHQPHAHTDASVSETQEGNALITETQQITDVCVNISLSDRGYKVKCGSIVFTVILNTFLLL